MVCVALMFVFLIAVTLFGFEGSPSLYETVGANRCEVPPVPIPNTEVKLTYAENT